VDAPYRTIVEPFKIKVVEPIAMLDRAERAAALAAAHYNLFALPAAAVTYDLLTDSGTTAMSTRQWAQMMLADDSYAGSRSFARFEAAVRGITGYRHVIPTHQGRAAERILFALTVQPGLSVPSNTHFDTTRANIEFDGGEAVDLVIPEGRDPAARHPFKGDVDTARLEAFLAANPGRVPLGMVTITNNSGGGQPVSLRNLREVSGILRRHRVPFILDACRFAENAWFVKTREPGQGGRSVADIAAETFALADGCTMSAKKDGMVNMGGFLALDDDALAERARSLLILTEGFPTYGGCAARDLEAMAVGLYEAMDERYLEYRHGVMEYLAAGLDRLGIPIVQPAGGHAVYIDARAFLPHIEPEHFPGQALACALYLEGGIRCCEIGSVMFGKVTPDGRFLPAALELVRLALPRRVYTQSHIDRILEHAERVAAAKDRLPGYAMTHRPRLLPHFTARFAPLPATAGAGVG